MNRSDYAYSVAYVRAIENRLLTKSDIENLILAKSADDVLRIISDKGYGSGITGENFDKALNDAFTKCFEEITDIAPEDSNLEILLYKNDFHNLKVVLKGVQIGVRDYENYIINPSTVDYETLIKGIASANFDDFPQMLKSVAQKAYDILGKTGDSQLSDTIIDKEAMDYTLLEAKKTKNEFLIGLVKLTNTLTDIKIAARCALTQKDAEFINMAISQDSSINRDELLKTSLGGIASLNDFLSSSGYTEAAKALKKSVADYEKYADNTINDYMKNSKYITLGIEPLLAYIYSKQNEIQAIRIILSAKQNGISEDKIRMRLRSFV